jgi:Cysteine dioxygenase type I
MDSLPSTIVLNTDEIDLCEDYKEYFEEFIEDLKKTENEEVGNIEQLINKFSIKLADIIDFDKIKPSGTDKYSRNCLGRHASGWELMVMCWSKDQITSIHGHPYICSYNFVKGEFDIEIYNLDSNNRLIYNKNINVSENSIYTDIGIENSFSNHVHRIKCKSEIGYSIHIYSDDARKGTQFPEN